MSRKADGTLYSSKRLTLVVVKYDVTRRAVERGNRSSELDVVFSI